MKKVIKENKAGENKYYSNRYFERLYFETNGAILDTDLPERILIDLHKDLINASDDEHDYGYDMIAKLIRSNSGANKEFLRSYYVSDYFKQAIKEIVNPEDFSESAIKVINSGKDFKDMSSGELYEIYSGITNYYNRPLKVVNVYTIADGKPNGESKDFVQKRVHNISYFFKEFLFNCPGENVRGVILLSAALRDKFARYILNANGLNDDPAFYAGRGVCISDLNSQKLYGIFYDLLEFDSTWWAKNFLELVKKMETLGATEFINTFLTFAAFGFISKVQPSQNNYSLESKWNSDYERYNAAETISVFALFNAKKLGNDLESQIHASRLIKDDFFKKVEEYAHYRYLGFDYEYEYDEALEKNVLR